nr:hypothetical protein [Halomonas socia]
MVAFIEGIEFFLEGIPENILCAIKGKLANALDSTFWPKYRLQASHVTPGLPTGEFFPPSDSGIMCATVLLGPFCSQKMQIIADVPISPNEAVEKLDSESLPTACFPILCIAHQMDNFLGQGA